MVFAEEILETLIHFYAAERTAAVAAGKIWLRSTATPIPGAGLRRASYEEEPHLLKAAPSSHIEVRDIIQYCAYIMFKDYYCSQAHGAGKYPEIYGILKRSLGIPVLVRTFGKRLERLRKKVSGELNTRAHTAAARDYYEAFLLGMDGWTVGIASTPAAWAGAVAAAAAAAVPVPAPAPAPEPTPEPAPPAPEITPAATPPSETMDTVTEEDAKAAAAAIAATKPPAKIGWFSSILGGWW